MLSDLKYWVAGLYVACLVGIVLAGVYGVIYYESNVLIDTHLFNNETFDNLSEDDNFYANYLQYKEHDLYTGAWGLQLLNWIYGGLLFSLFGYAFHRGRNTPPVNLGELMTRHLFIMMFAIYLLNIVLTYLSNIFLDQLINILWQAILDEMYFAKIIIEYYAGILLGTYCISWFANYIRYFEIIK